MACCIAIALVVAMVRKGWYALLPGRRPPEPGFAPPAYRAGPGAEAAPRTPDRSRPAPAPSLPGRGRGSRRGAVLLAAGAAWTGVSVLEMHVLHTLHLGHGAAGLAVHGFGLLLFVAGLLAFLPPARARRAAPHRLPAPEVT
jgi:hypothetical protein